MSKVSSSLPSLLRLSLGQHVALSYTTGNPLVDERARAFRAQIAEWAQSGRVGIPLLRLDTTAPIERGRCISCGDQVDGWRCAVCLEAVEMAVGLTPRPSSPGERAPGR